MKRILFSCLLVIAWLVHLPALLAVEASPHAFTVAQPDGSEVSLRILGNEHFHWLEDSQGYTVVEQNRAYYYALGAAEPGVAFQATNYLVGKVDPGTMGIPRGYRPSAQKIQSLKSPDTAPHPFATEPITQALGDVPNAVILMRFENHTTRPLPTPTDFDVIFNAPGGDPTLAPTGSVRDVYLKNSYGQMRLNSKVFEWVTLSNTEQFFAAGVSGLGTKIRDAITEALDRADAQIDFSKFDTDGDGFVDAITFIHSGYGAEWGGTDSAGVSYKDRIWSHRWTIPTWTSAEGVKVRDYHISPGLWGLSGTAPGRIGVICHETGHFFGLPDLYDTSGAGSGIGSWAMMANSWGFDGSQHYPPHFCAWSRIRLGWTTPIDIASAGEYEVKAAEEPGGEIYKLSTGFATDEYLLVENRQPLHFDAKIPAGVAGAGGLAVWHIDEAKPANNDPGWPGQSGWPTNNKHYRIALLQADGDYDLEKGVNRGDAGDVYRGGFRALLDETTVPNTDGYQGGVVTHTGISISEISATDTTMTFCLNKACEPAPDCCPVVASASFPWSPAKTLSANDNLLFADIELDREMIVHVSANAAVESDTKGTEFRTGFYNKETKSAMWTPSYRRVRLGEANSSTYFGSAHALKLKAGKHRIYWKIWVSGANLRFNSSGTLLVKAFAPKALPGPPAAEIAGVTSASVERIVEQVDEEGHAVLRFAPPSDNR